MKKILCMAFLLCTVVLFGCSSPDSVPKATPTPWPDTDQLDQLNASLPFFVTETVEAKEDGRADITLMADSSDIAHYGDVIYKALLAANDIFGVDAYDMKIMFFSDSTINFVYDGDSASGYIFDYRSGESKMTKVTSKEDIAKIFPALNLLEE